MSRDARFDYASATSDSDRGWDFREEPAVTSHGILRNLPAFIIILAVLGAVSALWWIA